MSENLYFILCLEVLLNVESRMVCLRYKIGDRMSLGNKKFDMRQQIHFGKLEEVGKELEAARKIISVTMCGQIGVGCGWEKKWIEWGASICP